MKDLTGLPVGFLKVLKLAGKDKWGYKLYKCIEMWYEEVFNG